jgi:hypothetical protein
MNLAYRDEVSHANFRPSQEAADFEKLLDARLGGRPRYETVRLMLGRSLLESEAPKPMEETSRAAKGDLRGRELFGQQLDLWIALFVIEGGLGTEIHIDDFKAAVEAHWARGCALLKEDLENAGNDIVKLAMNLANRLPLEANVGGKSDLPVASTGPISLRIGDISTTHPGGEPVQFVINRTGSPHIVLMGKTGQGKTRIGVNIAQQILQNTKVPFIYIDPKPDFAPGGNYNGVFTNYSDATNLVVGEQPIPLDFLPRPTKGNTSLQSACMRLRDSICKSTPSVGALQRDRLLTCIERISRNPGERSLPRIFLEYKQAMESEAQKNDSILSLLSEVTRFNAFVPTMTPAEFFSRSWVISLSSDIPESYKNLIMQFLLDAEAAFWLNQDDAPLVDGHRGLRHLLVIDEAKRILKKARSDSLVDLITRSRSRGCCIMLLSQDPGDFEGTDYDFMQQIGTVISFACNQTDRGLTALKGVFGRRVMPNEFSDSRLTEGLAFCKLPQHEPEVIRCW